MPVGPEISDQSTITQSRSAIASVVEDQAVILDVESGFFFQLNPVGSRIWWALEAPSTLASLCQTLENSFEVPPETCRAEVLEFINGLSQKGLVEIR